MFLRFLMVGLVSCLGLEVPSPPAGAGPPQRCAFCEGRPTAEVPPVEVAEELPMPDGLDAFAGGAEEPEEPDALFRTAMTATLDEFRADLAAVQPEPAAEQLTEVSAEPAPGAEPAIEPAGEDLYPGLAYALNREAEGLSIVAAAPVEPAAVAIVEAGDPPVAVVPSEPASRGERIEAAVRLTGQAVHAWLSVLQAPAVAYEAEGSTVSR